MSFVVADQDTQNSTFESYDIMKKKKNKIITCPHPNEYALGDFFRCRYGGCKFEDECEDISNKLQKEKQHEPKTKNKTKSKKHKKKKQDSRGLYIPRSALNKLLNLTYHTCVRHYLFYLKEGIRQKTNRPWCNKKFTAKGLGCSAGTVETAKTALVKACFIKKIREKCKDGRYGKGFIELKYYPSKFVIEKAEYQRRLDKYAEQLAEWANVFTSDKMKLEIEIVELKKENKKLRHIIGKLKNK